MRLGLGLSLLLLAGAMPEAEPSGPPALSRLAGQLQIFFPKLVRYGSLPARHARSAAWSGTIRRAALRRAARGDAAGTRALCRGGSGLQPGNGGASSTSGCANAIPCAGSNSLFTFCAEGSSRCCRRRRSAYDWHCARPNSETVRSGWLGRNASRSAGGTQRPGPALA